MASFPSYADSALTLAASVDGTWGRAIEVVIGGSRVGEVRFWVYNGTGAEQLFSLDIQPTQNFVVQAKPTWLLKTGSNFITIPIEATSRNAPATEDFVIRYFKPRSSGDATLSYAGTSYTSWDAWASGQFSLSEDEFRVEVTAHFLEAGDGRFPGAIRSALYSPESFAMHIGSGAGYVTPEFRDSDMRVLGEMMYPLAMWGVNKHLYHNPLYGPMRKARLRSDAIDYRPPGLLLYPPPVRRQVLSKAYRLTNLIGSQAAIVEAFSTLGVDTREIRAVHDVAEHTWKIEIPQYALDIFNPDFLGQFALYHVDAYETVTVDVLGASMSRLYTSIDYTNLSFTS